MADPDVKNPEDQFAGREQPRRLDSPQSLIRVHEATSTVREKVAATFEREVDLGRVTLWLPVLFGAGIVVYFGLPREPSLIALVVGSALAMAATVTMRRRAGWFRLWLTVSAVLAGLTVVAARTAMVTAPILATPVTGDLAGWVESIERFGPNERRIVVRVLSLEDIAPDPTPYRVRITVRGSFDEVAVGAGIVGLVSLQTPPGPVMPGGYDFGRDLFYERIGATGFAYGPPDLVDLGTPPLGIRIAAPIATLREAIGARIEVAIPGAAGQIANALVTGDRGGIPDETAEALRIAGLGHILAISGLHMALVAGAVFAALRALLALSPTLALRRPIKKWAAIGALVTGAAYLVLSGGSIATQRSFIMLSVVLVAVLLDRRAFSVRNVAVAATIVLVLTPEAVLTASFQMSFAATLALIAGYEVLSDRRRKRLAIGPPAERTLGRTLLFWIGGLALTSVLAGLATTPFAAFHFNRTAPLSLLANVIALPALTMLVMPSALIAVLLMPFGLEQLPLSITSAGLNYIIGVAEKVTEWTGSSGLVPTAPGAALVFIAVGLLWLCLWRLRWRLLGVPLIAVGVAAAMNAIRPDILVDDLGDVVAVRGPAGGYQIIGSPRSFEAENWLRADADPRSTGLTDAVTCDPLGCTAPIGTTGARLAVTLDRSAFVDDCRLAAVVVTTLDAPADCAALVIDGASLQLGGAHAIYIEGGPSGAAAALRIVTARSVDRRPWMPPLPERE